MDKLVKVWRKNGRAVWVLIYIEVQTQRDRLFGRRMYQYNYRIFDHYNRSVVSLPVLADDNPNWRPDTFRDALWGWSVTMNFPPEKLLDYANREAELEADGNPFARIVLAHLKAIETRRDPAARRTWKFRLVRGLYEQGFEAEDVRQLFRIIDWLMDLPLALDQIFWDDVETFEEERSMPFITTPERLGIKKGLLQAIEDALQVRFGEEGVKLMPEVKALEDLEKYRAMNKAIVGATTLDDIRQACADAAAPPPPTKKKRSKRGSA